MTSIVLIFTSLLALAGMISLSARNPKTILNKIVTAFIACGSLLTIGLLLLTFGRIDGAATIQFARWQLPLANFVAGIDPLSAFFLIPLLILSVSASLYGPQYFARHPAGRMHWLFYCLLVAGMIMVLVAQNALLFILSWEVMSISSFFLVITDKKNPESMRAGWIYFVTAHIGTAFLFALFFLLSGPAGSFDFSTWKNIGFHGQQADVIFVLALIAFGLKAGFIPFHVWLPLAHPAAPSHVSAIMSGIMIKMGIYGILRILTFLTPYHAWWGILLIGIGAVSGILGVLFAIGQHDIKRLLAYHSVENIGIILLGIGLGIVGVAYNSAPIAVFGFAGGVLHIFNHALFKGLLFLGAGAIIRQTGTGEIDRLGGLIKSMPRTGFLFLAGAMAICGLPFFNGFISELMIYTGGIKGAVINSQPVLSMLCLVVILSLALIGGLAAACFTKAFGIMFLGEARNKSVQVQGDVPNTMLAGMWILGALCFLIGIGSPMVLRYLIPPVSMLAATSSIQVDIASLYSFSITVSIILAVCAIVVVVVAFLRMILGRKRSVATGATWDCGYSRPDASMQYTASSFAGPIVEYFKRLLAHTHEISRSTAYFPADSWTFHSSVNDWFLTKVFAPAFLICDKVFASLRWFQSGKSGQYVLYISVTVLCLIIWKFFL